MKLKAGGKVIIGAAIAIGVGFAANYGLDKGSQLGYFSSKPSVASAVPTSLDLPTAGVISGNVSNINVTKTDNKTVINIATIPWNATAGLHFAANGTTTHPGSIFDKSGVQVAIKRIDQYDQMIAEMTAFAKARSAGNKNPTEGIALHIIMGDGAPNHMRGLNAALAKYDQSAEIIGIAGFSRGEDKCMLPLAAKTNPQKARGMTVGGVPRDGDLHICFKWAGDNGVPINANAKTYNPNALNILEVDDFNKSDQNLIAGYCEDRPVVNDAGQLVGKTVKVCQNGTATWTPGDVTVAQKVKGIATVASTKEYANQMGSIIIGNKQWMAENAGLVNNFLAGVMGGSESILMNESALDKVSAIQAKTYAQEDAAYWKKYFKGVVETYNGATHSLGGSAVAGLSDNESYFGLNGKDNVYKKVYTIFGNLDKTYYPNELPDFPEYETVVNTAYLRALLKNTTSALPAQSVTYSTAAQVKEVVSNKSWSIEFESGKDTFSPNTTIVLEELLNQMSIGNLTLRITGHTDNVGDPKSNLALSNKRANAVKNFLMTNAPNNFPTERIRARGYGDTQSVATNDTAEGRAKNRRVEVSQIVTD